MEPSEQELVEAYKHLFKLPEGETVLADLKEAFYDIHTINPDQTDAEGINKATWLAGCRWVVGYIISQLEYEDPPAEADNHNHAKGTYL